MIPIPPLDGSKVLSWNPLVYGVVAVPLFIAVILFG
jgi:Zn-dependent protease